MLRTTLNIHNDIDMVKYAKIESISNADFLLRSRLLIPVSFRGFLLKIKQLFIIKIFVSRNFD